MNLITCSTLGVNRWGRDEKKKKTKRMFCLFKSTSVQIDTWHPHNLLPQDAIGRVVTITRD